MEDLRVLFFFYMIQALLMVLCSSNFFDVKFSLRQIFFCTVLYGCSIWLVRGFYAYHKISWGSHSLVLAILYCTLLLLITKNNLIYCLGMTFFSFSLVLLGGGLISLGISCLGTNINAVIENIWLHVFLGHLENLFLILYLLVNRFFNFSLISFVGEMHE